MVTIRRASGEDAERVLEHYRLVGGETDNLMFGSEGESFPLEVERLYLDSIRESKRHAFFIAEDGGEVVGTGTFSPLSPLEKPRLSHRGVISITVKKSRWGEHIGTRMMEKLLDFAKNSAGVDIVSLDVRSDNERAKALYEKFGFKKVGVFDGMMQIDGEYISCDTMRLSFSGR